MANDELCLKEFMKQTDPEFLIDVVELVANQEKASETRELSTEPIFQNHLNRIRVSVTTLERLLHNHTLTSELHMQDSVLFHDKFPPILR